MIDKILKEVVSFISDSSYWICLYAATGGNIAYMLGIKKGIKVTLVAVIIYILIESII